MLSWFILAKGATAAGCAFGAWMTWRSMPLPAARAKLITAFKRGGLLIKYKRGDETLLMLPTVRRIKFHLDHMKVVFTVPVGIDPEAVHNHLWVFKQAFGPNAEIYGDNRVFTLTVYDEDLHPFPYNAEEISPLLEGLRLPIIVGKSRSGWEVYDMVEYPHLLIAGETGSGKSTQLRAVLTTLIRHTNAELYLADLKRSEFHLFRDIAKQVVNNEDDLRRMLYKVRKELTRRGDLLDTAGVTHVDDLSESPPYIIVCVDEVALIKDDKECMAVLDDIGAVGRALGVFLILSMQRPDAKVLEGRLKSNLSVRMAFRHADELNSRITLGSGNAADITQEQRGRMYLRLNGLTKAQGPLLGVQETKELLSKYKRPKLMGEPIDIEGYPVEEEESLFGTLI